MVGVFASFVLNGDPTSSSSASGSRSPSPLDATIVAGDRPATMVLLGECNWWLPRWLERGMPHVDIEGERLLASLADEEEPGIAPTP